MIITTQHSSRVMRQCTNRLLSKSTTKTMHPYLKNGTTTTMNNNESVAAATATAASNNISNLRKDKESNEKSIKDSLQRQQLEYVQRKLEYEEYSPHNPYAPSSFAQYQQEQQQMYYNYISQQRHLTQYTTHYTQQLPYYNTTPMHPSQQYTTHYYSTSASNAAATEHVKFEPPTSKPIVMKEAPSPQQSPKPKAKAASTVTPEPPTKKPKAAGTLPSPTKKTTTTSTATAADVEKEKARLKAERVKLAEIRKANTQRFHTYLTTLPQLMYPDHYKVECAGTMIDANEKLAKLLGEDKSNKFGLDLEWPPCFVKGQQENKVSLVQICSAKQILLIQLSRINGIPIELLKFFEDKKKLKSGVNIANDGLKLRRDFGIVTNGLVELAHLAENAKSPKLEITHLRSLRALTGMFMEQHMPKGKVRLSNWAKPELTSQQIKYAATDAYASYQLFVILDDLRNTKIPLKIKHMIEDLGPIEKEEEKVIKKVSEKRHIHNNKATPTQTVSIVKKKSITSAGSHSPPPSPSSPPQENKK